MTATPPPTPPAPASARRRPPRWTVVLTAVAVGAVLAPISWVLSRPDRDAGVPLEQALAGPSDGPAASAPPAATEGPGASRDPEVPAPRGGDAATGPSPFGPVAVRDASLDAAAGPPDPAPARLLVDGLDIDATVDAVGVEDDGSMVIPAEIDRVGWYRFGAAAGAVQGNAVLAGHVDAAGEGPGALFDLRGVEIGTVVTVVDEAGREHEYEVIGRETVIKDVLPVDDIFAREGEHRLVVVTCGGPFIPELRSYRDDVVATAVPVDAA